MPNLAAVPTPLAPFRALRAYLARLVDAFGFKYVAAVILTYGANQGIGGRFLFSAQEFFVLDSLGLDSATYGQLYSFANIPWQLKSLFGLLSDTVPVNGRHRSPYMLLAGCLGVIASTLLTFVPSEAMGYSFLALLLLMANVNFALPDVMIDATVAERAKLRPDRAADLQALCWGSLGMLQIPAAISKGYLMDAGGPRLLFGLAIVTASCVTVPPLLGWLKEKRRPGYGVGPIGSLADAKQLCGDVSRHTTKRRILTAAGVVGLYSLTLGIVQLNVASVAPNAVAIGVRARLSISRPSSPRPRPPFALPTRAHEGLRTPHPCPLPPPSPPAHLSLITSRPSPIAPPSFQQVSRQTHRFTTEDPDPCPAAAASGRPSWATLDCASHSTLCCGRSIPAWRGRWCTPSSRAHSARARRSSSSGVMHPRPVARTTDAWCPSSPIPPSLPTFENGQPTHPACLRESRIHPHLSLSSPPLLDLETPRHPLSSNPSASASMSIVGPWLVAPPPSAPTARFAHPQLPTYPGKLVHA